MNIDKKEEIAYAWNFAADVGNGCQFQLSGNFPKGIDAVTMNAEVDKVRAVFNRQQAKAASMGASDEISQLELRLANAKEDLAKLEDKFAEKGGGSAQERQQRDIALSTLDRMAKDLSYKKAVLDRLKEEAK